MTEIHIHETGPPESETIIFLHGVGISGSMWTDHMERLVEYHCLAPDLPGFGYSNHLDWVSLDHTADLVIELIKGQLPDQRAHLVGLSLGGSIIHTVLARRSDLIESAIIDGAGAIPSWSTPLQTLGMALMSPFLHTKPLIETMAWRFNMDEQAKQDLRLASTHAFRRALTEANSNQITEQEINASCPMLLVAGERDLPGARPTNAALANLMPNAEAKYVPQVGHGWVGQEPDLHQRMVQAWITGSNLSQEFKPETTSWPEEKVTHLLDRCPTVASTDTD
jgi:pimeloyl-ACP methyl ester carboxylesterase